MMARAGREGARAAPAELRRLLQETRAQALSEYGLVLALLAGLRWVEGVGERLADDPKLLWSIGIVVVLALALASGRRR